MSMLEGKVAVITGTTSGIGERIAELFVEEGASVVAVGRREQEGGKLQERLGTRLTFLRTDVSVDADVRAMIDHAVNRFGRIDCLVNNAAVPSPMVSIADTNVDNFDEVMAVNVRGVLLGMKYVAPVMLKAGGGSIINISSLSALRAGWAAHSYCASKGAVRAAGFARSRPSSAREAFASIAYRPAALSRAYSARTQASKDRKQIRVWV